MEELKQMAADFGLKYAEKHELIKKNPLLGVAVACVAADGFTFGFEYEGTQDELKDKIADLALEYVEKHYEGIMHKEPLLGIAFVIAYRAGAEGGIAERDKVGLERDEQGNIIGISTNKN
jgi:hypothetical protein